jgi:uncharacterized protein YggE
MRKFIVLAALSAALASAPSAAAQEETTTRLSVTAEGQVQSEPDLAWVTLGVVTTNTNADAAMAENAEHMEALLRTLRGAGIGNRDIQTSRLNLHPQYNSSRDQRAITGYNAENQVRVRVRDLDRLPRLIAGAVGAGGNSLRSVGFGLDDPQTALDQARRSAVVEARRRAELYADAAGMHVVRMVSMSEAGSRGGGDDEIIVTASRRGGDDWSTPIQAGEIEVRSSMTVVFELR